MKVFKFIKWWWQSIPSDLQLIILFVSLWVLPCAISIIWLGQLGLILLASAFPAIMVFLALREIVKEIKERWSLYNDEFPTEDIAVVRKLKGIPTPSRSAHE